MAKKAKQDKAEGLEMVTAESRALDPHARDDYEPVFERLGTTRRVLGFITDDEDATANLGPGAIPRNTLDAITVALMRDEHTDIEHGDFIAARDQVKGHIDDLVEAGFVEERDDGTYGITDDGFVELKN